MSSFGKVNESISKVTASVDMSAKIKDLESKLEKTEEEKDKLLQTLQQFTKKYVKLENGYLCNNKTTCEDIDRYVLTLEENINVLEMSLAYIGTLASTFKNTGNLGPIMEKIDACSRINTINRKTIRINGKHDANDWINYPTEMTTLPNRPLIPKGIKRKRDDIESPINGSNTKICTNSSTDSTIVPSSYPRPRIPIPQNQLS